jgi:hypothetical protein
MHLLVMVLLLRGETLRRLGVLLLLVQRWLLLCTH